MPDNAETNRFDLYVSSEVAWGETPATPTMTQVRCTGEGLLYDKDTRQSEEIAADRMRGDPQVVGFNVNGPINFELSHNSFDVLLEGLLMKTFVTVNLAALSVTFNAAARTMVRATGDFTSAGIVPGMWLKIVDAVDTINNGTFKVLSVVALTVTFVTGTVLADESADTVTVTGKMLRNGTVKKSILIEKRFLDITKFIYYSGCRIGQMNLDFQAKEIVKGSFTVQGKTAVSSGATVSGVSTAANANTVLNCSANVAAITKDGVALTAPVKSMTLQVTNNLRVQDQIGSNAPAGIGTGFCDVSGTLEVYFPDLTLYDLMVAHTAMALTIRLVDNSGNIIIITLPRVFFAKGSPTAPGGNQDVMLPLEMVASRDTTTSCVVQIDVL